MSSWSFVPWLPLRHHFCSDGSTFSLSKLYIFLANIPAISFQIKGRQKLSSTALHFVGSFWHITVFPKVIQSSKGLSPSRICTAWVQWCKIFQPISLHTNFPRSFPVRHLSALHFYHFLTDFNFLHTVYILILFSTAFQPLIVLVVFFLYSKCHSKIWYYLQN